MEIKLGNLRLNKPVILAPLDGYTDIPFRLIVNKMNPDLMFTEFVNSDAIIYANEKSMKKIRILDEERPVAVQLFGKNPENMAKAAEIIETIKPEILDINFGCPSPSVAGHGSGSALLKDLPLLGKICESVVKSVKVPVTAKTRTGWDEHTINILETAKVMKESGIQMITLHPRTRIQKFKGQADWNYIKLLKENTDLPVIGNGDITTPEKAVEMFNETGCDGIMIGRQSVKEPWIFRQIKELMSTGNYEKEISLKERKELCIAHLDYSIEYKGEKRAQFEMRKLYQCYFRGTAQMKRFKKLAFATTDAYEVRKYITDIENILNDSSIDSMDLKPIDKWS